MVKRDKCEEENEVAREVGKLKITERGIRIIKLET